MHLEKTEWTPRERLMNIVRKPLLTEAVLLFSERGIAKEMLYPEFEALLDGMVSTPEFADETVEAVFLQISNRLHVRGAVFFTIDFDLDGNINSRVEHAAALPWPRKPAAGLIWVVVLFAWCAWGSLPIPSIDPTCGSRGNVRGALIC